MITEATKARFAREVAKYPADQKQSAVMACLSSNSCSCWLVTPGLAWGWALPGCAMPRAQAARAPRKYFLQKVFNVSLLIFVISMGRTY